MAQVFHLRCRHCGETMKKSSSAYCPPCNLYLCYRAMPMILGMLMTSEIIPALAEAPSVGSARNGQSRRKAYPHSRYILD